MRTAAARQASAPQALRIVSAGGELIQRFPDSRQVITIRHAEPATSRRENAHLMLPAGEYLLYGDRQGELVARQVRSLEKSLESGTEFPENTQGKAPAVHGNERVSWHHTRAH